MESPKATSGSAKVRASKPGIVSWAGVAFRALMLALALCIGQTRSLAEAVTRDQVASEENTNAAVTVSGPTALEMEANALAEAITNQLRAVSRGSAAKGNDEHPNLLLGFAVVVAGLLVLGKLGLKLAEMANSRHDPWAMRRSKKAETDAAEESSFSDFVTEFSSRNSQVAAASEPASEPANSRAASPASEETPNPHVTPIELFLEQSAKRLAAVRKLFSDIGREPGRDTQQRILMELRDEIRALRREADLPAARPLWQMAAAMDGLLHQLVERVHNVTPSTLRTLASAIDLLHALRSHRLDPDLVTTPPVRLLVVDDDSISRHAVAFSLKKVFSAPDVAANGEAALALAEKNSYDLVFLDIQMPGMDGFELCSRIHGTPHNGTTPIVFVTCRSDFEARARSTVMGGQDLMAKPFLTFELTLKALTLVLRRRLDGHVPAPAAAPLNPVSPEPEPEPALA